jgi:type VI secretion system protein ImpM
MSTDARLGFFGKLPSHGDFIERGLPHAFVAPWDRWLRGAIANSRELLGAAWLEHYLVAPIWRFALPAGVCGPAAWQGVVMPSVDRVNRHFPLTVALPRDPAAATLADLIRGDSWLGRCEEAALDALSASSDADALAERLRAIDAAIPHGPPCPSPRAGGELAWQLALPPALGADALALAVAQTLLRSTDTPYTLWWSEGSQSVERGLLIHRGLPSARDFTAMLDGRWGHWGWERCPVPDPATPGARGAQETGP